jgi:L-glyceraldehyde 3-phosphate reductase
VFSPLAQGLLSGKYLDRIPADSRAARSHQIHLGSADMSPALLSRIRRLHGIAEARGQSLAQMALAWVLRHDSVASALIGVSRVEQLDDCLAALDRLAFSAGELAQIEQVLAD